MIALACTMNKEKISPVQSVQLYIEQQCDSLNITLEELQQAVERKEADAILQGKFERARKYYKHIEAITELYFPGFSDAINGPAIDENETYEDKVIEATGFQVVEEYIYPETDTANYDELLRETKLLNSAINRLRQLITGNELTDEHIFQATRLQLLRIISLGISGFDSPVALKSVSEANHALEGIQQIISFYTGQLEEDKILLADTLKQNFASCYTFLNANTDFNNFNRAVFISEYMIPLSESMRRLQGSLNIRNRPQVAALNLQKANFFDVEAYQPKYFTNPSNRNEPPEMIRLGKLLFFDPILSGDNKRACASCHNPSRAFSDGLVKSLAFKGSGNVLRNAPSLINAAYQKMQFYDSRVMFQEDQAAEVISNPFEMHGNLQEAVGKLSKSKEYKTRFRSAYADTMITDRKIQYALASYVRSLSSFNSDFDRYMRKEIPSLPEEAIAGFNLFMGKGKCGTCHFMPLFNGTVPPMYTKSESEVLGVPEKPDTVNANVDPDLGKYSVYKGDLNRHAFKTPTVRNAALTAPYMHNGVFNILEEVIDFYNRGGGAGIGIDLPNQTLPPDRLGLTDQEKKNIISFIHSLTDTTGLTSMPDHLPSFPDPMLDSRKLGGEY